MPNNDQTTKITADLLLVHAPSVFDFRDRDDMLFAYLSDSDSVNVTTIYEMYPLGLLSIKERLKADGLDAQIVNLASLMLMHPDLDVDKLIASLEAPVFGLDLHWMAHCQGSIEVARKIKSIHPESTIIFGGLSSTYYAQELIQYPAVDIVVRGYDTLEPVSRLVRAIKAGERCFDNIPNLLYKTGAGVVNTGFSHKPQQFYNDVAVDWSFYKNFTGSPMLSNLIMTLPNSGCAMNCGWCGGSRYSYQNIMGLQKSLVEKDSRRVEAELRSLGESSKTTAIYALQCYSETKERFHRYLDIVQEMGYKSVSFEQYHLTDADTLARMARATRAYIMLSPESHDREISALVGRGNYSMAEMEAWIPKALDAGVARIMVWFFIGMPKQTPQSVLETVDYCERLMDKFPKGDVLPLLCPMVPFLDPGSRFFEEPEQNGYRLLYKSLEAHRQAMLEPLWYKRLNYETVWMSRKELQDITYEAVGRLVAIKAAAGILPRNTSHAILGMIDETRYLLDEMERALQLDRQLPPDLRNLIRSYNRKTLAYSNDQLVPTPRAFGSRWFDDFTVPDELISACKS